MNLEELLKKSAENQPELEKNYADEIYLKATSTEISYKKRRRALKVFAVTALTAVLVIPTIYITNFFGMGNKFGSYTDSVPNAPSVGDHSSSDDSSATPPGSGDSCNEAQPGTPDLSDSTALLTCTPNRFYSDFAYTYIEFSMSLSSSVTAVSISAKSYFVAAYVGGNSQNAHLNGYSLTVKDNCFVMDSDAFVQGGVTKNSFTLTMQLEKDAFISNDDCIQSAYKDFLPLTVYCDETPVCGKSISLSQEFVNDIINNRNSD